MDALLGELTERDELVVGRQAQLEPLRPDAQPEERRQLYRRTET
jgi:hypothetical protein